jgi:indolepyruvate ferredoxin oxidoreductase, beta subunit
MSPPAIGTRVIKLAILAVGGQGGGVLTGWITALAEGQGWWAQATSVAGVAQRTGATIYYVEMAPKDPARPGRAPVFALSPAPGDVDVLVAAELAEAGRAVLRGFVTERTTLIASSHRELAVAEKIAPGDGRTDPGVILRQARAQAGRVVAADLAAAAREAGAHISAALFGALAASGALPFPRTAFEATIRASGRGVAASLAAFAAAEAQVLAAEKETPLPPEPVPAPAADPVVEGPPALLGAWRELAARAAAYPEPVAAMAAHGLRRVVDYLDPAYGAEYLDRVEKALAADAAPHAFATAAAKHLANAMAYDDLPRVADLKLRAARSARIRGEAGAGEGEPVAVLDYFHPRMAEVVATLPAALGDRLAARPRLMAALDRVVDRGRRIRSDRITGFLALSLVAALGPHRRRLRRHRTETEHLEAWFRRALAVRAHDAALAVEVLNARRLIKGYSDTHARGLSKYDRVLGALPLLEGRPDAADWLRRLIAAALKDPDGTALDGALRTIASFTTEAPHAAERPQARPAE